MFGSSPKVLFHVEHPPLLAVRVCQLTFPDGSDFVGPRKTPFHVEGLRSRVYLRSSACSTWNTVRFSACALWKASPKLHPTSCHDGKYDSLVPAPHSGIELNKNRDYSGFALAFLHQQLPWPVLLL